jgi:putative tryptophan/tyrosine transport system substrate-binding protein
MRRREFIALLGGGAASWPVVAAAQQPARIKRIGLLMGSGASDPENRARLAGFEEALRSLGWKEGENILIERRWFGGSSRLAAQDAKEIVALKPDVIVANGTLGIEAVLGTTRITSTVFVLVGNPVGSGYVGSLAHPGGNVTGFSAFEPEIAGKWMQLVKEIAPDTRRVTVLFYPGYEFLWRGAEAASGALGLEVTQGTCHDASEIERAISATATSPGGALVVLPTPLFGLNRELIVRSAASHGLPAVYPFRYFTTAGGLVAYGINTVDLFQRASLYVDRILKGENAGDLPVQEPTKFQLSVNLKAATTLRLTVPPTMLARADEVIE